MLFNSHPYIFVFLPVTLLGYYLIAKRSDLASRMWLVAASLVFYAYWFPAYLLLIAGSILGNYSVAVVLIRQRRLQKRITPKKVLILGLVFNLGLLGYYKYADFFITNVNAVIGVHIQLLGLLLPLAISFFTFQQIAYLMDVYQGKADSYGLLNYALFVSFFPQLIAGPIVHHSEMMPQFADASRRRFNAENVSNGIFLFSLGLFKKIIVADTFAIWANAGFEETTGITFFSAWAATLSYTLQIYFDFSGYTDMALGSARLFNIKLPANFNTPYRAGNLQDFWRRWHMTLSRWLRDYVYIPLGGNRRGPTRTYVNLVATFFLGGLWHGAGWTFVVWGLLHGIGTSFHKLWTDRGFRLGPLSGWLGTFVFVNVAWVFFRASSLESAIQVLCGMVGINGVVLPNPLTSLGWLAQYDLTFGPILRAGSSHEMLFMMAVFGTLAVLGRNSLELRYLPQRKWTLATTCALLYAVNDLEKVSEFLYFNF